MLSSKSVLDSVPIAAPEIDTVNVFAPGLLKSTTKVAVTTPDGPIVPLDKIVLLTAAFTPVIVRLTLSEVAPRTMFPAVLFLIVTFNS